MALSTNIPRAIIKAPREILSNIIPRLGIKIKLEAIVTNNTNPIIKPLLKPINKSNTTITIATASKRLIIKELIAFSTSSAC